MAKTDVKAFFKKMKENEERTEYPDTPLVQEYEKMWGKAREITKEIPIADILSFRNKNGKAQPFKLNKDKVNQLKASIKDVGMITPIIVRPLGNNKYQIISGHHRYQACKALSFQNATCIIRNMTDEEAEKIVIESNIQRMKLLPSEYGEIFSRYLDMRKDLELTVDEISEKLGVSKRVMYRYRNVASCIPEVQDLFDTDKLYIEVVDKICVLSEEEQLSLVEWANAYEGSITSSILQKYLDGEDLTEEINEPSKEETVADVGLSGDSLPVNNPDKEVLTEAYEETYKAGDSSSSLNLSRFEEEVKQYDETAEYDGAEHLNSSISEIKESVEDTVRPLLPEEDFDATFDGIASSEEQTAGTETDFTSVVYPVYSNSVYNRVYEKLEKKFDTTRFTEAVLDGIVENLLLDYFKNEE